MEAASVKIGVRYADDSFGDTFIVEEFAEDGRIAELDDGSWYELHGPEGLLAKLAAGVIREAA